MIFVLYTHDCCLSIPKSSSWCPTEIQRAFTRLERTAFYRVRIDHCCSYIAVAQEFLYGTYIIVRLK